MTALSIELGWGIVCVILIIAAYVAAGFVSGRICVQIIREKNPDMSEVLWFWLGFITNVIAIVLTLIVKEKKADSERKEIDKKDKE